MDGSIHLCKDATEPMQLETAGQVFCWVHSICRDVKESTKDAMGQCVCVMFIACAET